MKGFVILNKLSISFILLKTSFFVVVVDGGFFAKNLRVQIAIPIRVSKTKLHFGK